MVDGTPKWDLGVFGWRVFTHREITDNRFMMKLHVGMAQQTMREPAQRGPFALVCCPEAHGCGDNMVPRWVMIGTRTEIEELYKAIEAFMNPERTRMLHEKVWMLISALLAAHLESPIDRWHLAFAAQLELLAPIGDIRRVEEIRKRRPEKSKELTPLQLIGAI